MQVRQQEAEVVALARLAPSVLAGRSRSREIGLEVGRHAARLLVVAARDPDQARLGGVLRQRLLVVRKVVQEQPDLVRRKAVVLHAHERRELVGASSGTAWGHLRALVPGQHGARPVEVMHLGQALAQLGVLSRLHTATLSAASGGGHAAAR